MSQIEVDLVKTLHSIGAIQFGEFQLKSGLISPFYINLRKIISYPPLLRSITTSLYDKTKGCAFDLVCGVPYTALPIATCYSLDHNIPMIMRRKEKKNYGTKQDIEGVFNPGQRCLIIEDLITTGASILETAQALQAQGIVVADVVAIIDREQGGRDTLSKQFNVHTLFSLTELLQVLQTLPVLTPVEETIVKNLLLERGHA